MEPLRALQALAIAVFCTTAPIVSGCACDQSNHFLGDGVYELRVDRQWKGEQSTSYEFRVDREGKGDQSIGGPFVHAEDYISVQNGPIHTIVVSENGEQVSVGGSPGRLCGRTDEQAIYDVEINMGATLYVWPTFDGLRAELTLCGSGVPVIESERGELVRIR